MGGFGNLCRSPVSNYVVLIILRECLIVLVFFGEVKGKFEAYSKLGVESGIISVALVTEPVEG